MHSSADHNHSFASFAQFQRHFAQFIKTRSHNPIRAEGDESPRCRVLHVRLSMGAIFRAQLVAHRLPRLRVQHQSRCVRLCHVARLCIVNGQPDLLHHLQQGVPTGVQKRAALSLQEQGDLASDADESSVAAVKVRLRFNRQSSLRRHRKSRRQQAPPRCDTDRPKA